MSETERPDWLDGAPVETETAVVPRDDDGRVVRPDWTEAPLAPVTVAPVTEPPTAGEVAGAPVPENAMAPTDVVPDSIFASPEDLDPETAPALDMAKAVLAEDASWADTIAGFTEHLTVAAQDALVAEMAAQPAIDAEHLTPDQIVRFTSTPEGKELWDEWGPNALEKATVARARLNRLIGNLPEHEVSTFDALFNSLPPAAFKEALRQLAE